MSNNESMIDDGRTPVMETPEQIRQREAERKEDACRVVRHNTVEITRMIERMKMRAQHQLERAVEDQRIAVALQEEFHYILRVLEQERLV